MELRTVNTGTADLKSSSGASPEARVFRLRGGCDIDIYDHEPELVVNKESDRSVLFNATPSRFLEELQIPRVVDVSISIEVVAAHLDLGKMRTQCLRHRASSIVTGYSSPHEERWLVSEPPRLALRQSRRRKVASIIATATATIPAP
jgi:hypothetical protein